jgi:hypothetical protein
MIRTMRERLVEGLTAVGGEVIPGRSSKYVTIRTPAHPREEMRPKPKGPWFWFVGKSGTLRCSFKGPASTKSVAAERTKAWLLARVPR